MDFNSNPVCPYWAEVDQFKEKETWWQTTMVTLYATFKARGSPRRRADQVLAGVAAHLPLGPPRRRRRRHQRRPPLRPDQGGTNSHVLTKNQMFYN